MSDADKLLERLRATLPADRLTSWRSHDVLDDLEALVWELEDGLRAMSDQNVELMRQQGDCPSCGAWRAMFEDEA